MQDKGERWCEWEGGVCSMRHNISNININCNAQTLNLVCYNERGKLEWSYPIGQLLSLEPSYWLSTEQVTPCEGEERILYLHKSGD